MFFVNSVGFGVGLAMDAFSVSLANGLHEPCMKKGRMTAIAGVFTFFQFAMPLIGWICVNSIARLFTSFERFIPWIALGLLLFIGGKMLIDGIRNKDGDCDAPVIGFLALMIQGVATSIDALSIGFQITSYKLMETIFCCAIIGAVTFFICMLGLFLGKKFGTKLSGKASILGGVILILIGLEIFITGII